MAFDRENSGALYKNTRKEKETHPTMTGKCAISGKQYWMNAWVKEGPEGKFISIAFKPVEGGRTPPPSVDLINDEIGF